MTGSTYKQFCALARAAEIVGERWTLLIIRELLLGPKRFGDLHAHLGGMSPTLLTSRLNALIEDGLIVRRTLPPPASAQLYELTYVGRDLQAAVRELIRWGGHFLFPLRPDDVFEPDWVLLALDAITRRGPTPALQIGLVVRYKTESADFTIEGGEGGSRIVRGKGACKAVLEGPFDAVLQIIGKRVSLDDAIKAKRAVVQGPLAPVRKLPQLFDLAEMIAARPKPDA